MELLPPQLPQSNIPQSPLERLETAVDSMTLAQEKNSKILEGMEPVMEALIAAYLKGAKEINEAISSIQDYLSKIEPVQINQEAIAAVGRLEKVFSKKDLFKIPKPEVIQESKETVKLLKELIDAVELKPLEVNLSNDFTVIEKALGRIEKLIKFEIPLDGGRVAVKLSDDDLKRLTKAQSQAWQTVVSNAKLSNVAGVEINPATEDTLALLLTQLQAINTNTDTLEVKAETINLNTDALEAKLDTLITQTVAPVVTANVKPVTSGGLSAFHLVAAATTNATVVKASAGQLYGWYIYNSNASARKVAFHNAASTPTAGASVFFTVTIPPNSAANVEFTNGIAFSTGIAITTVTGLADSDATAVAVNDLLINLFYK